MTKIVMFSDDHCKQFAQAEQLIHKLSPTEQSITARAIHGYTDCEIADHLRLSPRTVQNYIRHITDKARLIYGENICFRNHVVPKLHTYYFCIALTPMSTFAPR